MKKLTTHPALNAQLGVIAAHTKLTSFAIPRRFENEDTANDMFMRSHVSNCCEAIVLYDLEMPYCASCGELCQPVVHHGLSN